jgi:hypothetical protein
MVTKENFNMKKELLEGLTEEQITKVKACKNPEELLALAKQEGIELSDEQLSGISGGCYDSSSVERYEIDEMQCPECLNSHCMEKVSDAWYRCKYCNKITVNKNLQ